MIIYLSLLVAVIGVLMYALAANPKLQEIGPHQLFRRPAGVPSGVGAADGGRDPLSLAPQLWVRGDHTQTPSLFTSGPTRHAGVRCRFLRPRTPRQNKDQGR